MDNNKKYWFFGSKLNTVLLLILIILMIVALRWMYQDREKYFPIESKDKKIYRDDMSSKDAEYFDTLTVPNPKLEDILGYDGLPLSQGISGNKEDLVSFSIKPGQEVSGIIKATGILSGGYFFEGNLPISILDQNKNVTSYGPGHGQATTDWMTTGPVSFSVGFDFSNIPKGLHYIQITKDDPSEHPLRGRTPAKQIFIPIIVK